MNADSHPNPAKTGAGIRIREKIRIGDRRRPNVFRHAVGARPAADESFLREAFA